MSSLRSILHVDMDAFFASVEQLDNPSLRGRPVLVGHDGPRGVVATASYEARKFGCHSAQPMVLAKRRCPQAVVVPGRFHRYREVSARIFSIFDDVAPLVEPLSIDEAYLDLTGTDRLIGPPEQVAMRIKRRIHQEVGLTASIGVSFNKFLAKLAGGMNKPDGLTIIRPEDVDRILPPLPVESIFGIGPRTAEKLHQAGVSTIAHLRAAPAPLLQRLLGRDADHYLRLAHGLDNRPVIPDRQAKSIGHEQTFERDQSDPDILRNHLLEQVESVAARLRRSQLLARGLSLKLRYGDYRTITRACRWETPTDITDELFHAAQRLFNTWAEQDFMPLRLIGVTATLLTCVEQQPLLFPDPEKQRRRNLDRVVDQINQRLGPNAIRRGR